MALRTVAKVQQFSENRPIEVEVGGTVLGMYRSGGRYYAYENVCAHQGGPVCEGEVMGRAKCDISPSGRRLSEYISTEEFAIVCPWHGVEYDLKTGFCTADPTLRLKSLPVTVDGDEVKVEI